MQIDTEHLHYWMQAIRQSPDPMRTMDAFWSGQLKSKEWLIENLRKNVNKFVSIDIHGGWVGVLASMLFQSDIYITNIRSVDLDPTCEPIATMMNKKEEIVGKFRAITADMCNIRSDADVIINTSCEHITQDQFDLWKTGMPHNSLLVLQSNNYDIPEHVRTAATLEEFKTQCNINVLWAGELELPLYKRFMIIGKQ
jgi:desulfoferrodoxin (superoxide reductase-like protein)